MSLSQKVTKSRFRQPFGNALGLSQVRKCTSLSKTEGFYWNSIYQMIRLNELGSLKTKTYRL